MKKISSLGLTVSEEVELEFLIQERIDYLVRTFTDGCSSEDVEKIVNSNIALLKSLQSKLFEDT
ncbi:MAG: hypothetical protein UH241_10245 [Acutalibacteraceae bacterium]|nr:hypothetical protein [Acutalibacteraceae bacterium]